MNPGHGKFYVLDADKQWALRRIAELEKAIDDLGPEFEEVFAQSSETWHDNAPFDALRDRQSGLAAERQELKTVLNKAALACPKAKPGSVGIGSLVTVEENGKLQKLFIAGHWAHSVSEVVDGALVITCASPLGQALLGSKVDQTVSLAQPARTFVIKHVE